LKIGDRTGNGLTSAWKDEQRLAYSAATPDNECEIRYSEIED